MSLPSQKQMVWNILSNAFQSNAWHYPSQNWKKKSSPNQTFRDGFKFLNLGHSEVDENMDEIAIELVQVDERGNKYPQAVVCHVLIPWDYSQVIFEGKDVVFFIP